MKDLIPRHAQNEVTWKHGLICYPAAIQIMQNFMNSNTSEYAYCFIFQF